HQVLINVSKPSMWVLGRTFPVRRREPGLLRVDSDYMAMGDKPSKPPAGPQRRYRLLYQGVGVYRDYSCSSGSPLSPRDSPSLLKTHWSIGQGDSCECSWSHQ